MMQHEEPGIDAEAYAQGWRRDFKEAVKAGLVRDEVPVGESRPIRSIEVKRLTENPIHDYIVHF